MIGSIWDNPPRIETPPIWQQGLDPSRRPHHRTHEEEREVQLLLRDHDRIIARLDELGVRVGFRDHVEHTIDCPHRRWSRWADVSSPSEMDWFMSVHNVLDYHQMASLEPAYARAGLFDGWLAYLRAAWVREHTQGE